MTRKEQESEPEGYKQRKYPENKTVMLLRNGHVVNMPDVLANTLIHRNKAVLVLETKGN